MRPFQGKTMSAIVKNLKIILADTYALYLKTQNYHWHVRGQNFKALHGLFEEQYLQLAEAVDQLAERILILGDRAPATFSELNELKTIKDGESHKSSNDMVVDLAHDHGVLVQDIHKAMVFSSENHDEGTANLLADRIAEHEKSRWMLLASQEIQK